MFRTSNTAFCYIFYFFFFNDTATTEIYTYLHTLSLHDALPISPLLKSFYIFYYESFLSSGRDFRAGEDRMDCSRSEEHTSELQSLMRISYAVFCLKKKNNNNHKEYHDTTKPHQARTYNNYTLDRITTNTHNKPTAYTMYL